MHTLTVLISLVSGLLLSACGGGLQDVTLPPTVSKATVSGVASKGLIKNGSIKVYAASSNGDIGTLLATTTTDSQGRYTAVVLDYSGPVIIEATGSYLDEASGQTRTIDSSAPLHAVLPCACSSLLSVAVTPLTELAYQKAKTAIAGGAEVAAAFSDANMQVSGLFSFDITASLPVDPTPNTLQNGGNDQRSYTLDLAAISQMVKTGGTLTSVITGLNNAGAAAPNLVAAALNTFLNRNANNQTGYKNLLLSLSLTGTTAGNVGALDFTLNLPAGTTLPVDTTGAVSSSNFVTTGSATNVTLVTKYSVPFGAMPAKLRVIMIASNLLPDGNIATLLSSVPVAVQSANFTISSVTAKDANGVIVTGVGITVQ